jgi:DNA-binding HxlR family transcriptional regulator
MISKEKIEVPQVEGKETKIKNREVFFKMLSEVEFLIVKILYHSTNALDARSIHYYVAFEKFKRAEEHPKLNKKITIVDGKLYSKWFFKMSNLMKQNKKKWLSEISKKIKIPSYYLIARTLEELYLNGIVWRRPTVEKKEKYLYMLNPKVYSLLKEGENDKDIPSEIKNLFYSPLPKLFESEDLFKSP